MDNATKTWDERFHEKLAADGVETFHPLMIACDVPDGPKIIVNLDGTITGDPKALLDVAKQKPLDSRNGVLVAVARLALKHAALLRCAEALRVYADHKSWHWNGRAWEWNGDGSAFYKGDAHKPMEHPSSDAVDAECGSIARASFSALEQSNG